MVRIPYPTKIGQRLRNRFAEKTTARRKGRAMSANLLVMYPVPKNVAGFDRAYREEHLPYAGPRLAGATGVTTERLVGTNFAPRPIT